MSSSAETRIVAPREILSSIGEAMNTLNGVASAYPDAVSLAAGRPAAEYVRLSGLDSLIESSADLAFQYGPTAGHIREHLAKALARDEGVDIDPESLIVTNGAQEALLLLLMLLDRARDVLIVPDPCYVGITGAAALLGITSCVLPVSDSSSTALRAACMNIEAAGLRPRALYLIPDFANPLGYSIGARERLALLAEANRLGLLVIEDSPYRVFRYEGVRVPTLVASARRGAVAYVGTLSKAVSAGLRVGFIAWPGAPPEQWAALVRAKSFVSVITSPLAQSVVAGILSRAEFSLAAAAAHAILAYKARRDAACDALAAEFHDMAGVRWRRPGGGFFVSLQLPFEFTLPDMATCAREYGVIICPMTLFSISGGWRSYVRIAFSSVSPAALRRGIQNFASYVRNQLDGQT